MLKHSLGVLLLLASGCATLPQASSPKSGAGAPKNTGRCQEVGTETSPLVTEWPASEKARLQSLVATQPVAVKFAGCELEVVESCTLPGRYVWQRTSLATDTLDIDDKNELFSKLPIGAVKLEGELAQSGKLSVRTTVAGQLSLTDAGNLAALPLGPSCAEATHIVTRMSVGAFKLLSGSDISGRGGVSVPRIGAEAGSSRKEALLRESGDPLACKNATDQAPASQCASPIQLFLEPLRPEVQAQIVASGAVQIAIPEPDDLDESWSLMPAAAADLPPALHSVGEPCQRLLLATRTIAGHANRQGIPAQHLPSSSGFSGRGPIPDGARFTLLVDADGGGRWRARNRSGRLHPGTRNPRSLEEPLFG